MELTIAQLTFSSIVLFILYRTIHSLRKRDMMPFFGLYWIVFWLVILFFIVRDDLLITVAHKLGVSRGVDLAIYISIAVIFYLLYKIFVRLEQIQAQMTKLVRNDALKTQKK